MKLMVSEISKTLAQLRKMNTSEVSRSNLKKSGRKMKLNNEGGLKFVMNRSMFWSEEPTMQLFSTRTAFTCMEEKT